MVEVVDWETVCVLFLLCLFMSHVYMQYKERIGTEIQSGTDPEFEVSIWTNRRVPFHNRICWIFLSVNDEINKQESVTGLVSVS